MASGPLLNVERDSYLVLVRVFIFDTGHIFYFKSSFRGKFPMYLLRATLTNVAVNM